MIDAEIKSILGAISDSLYSHTVRDENGDPSGLIDVLGQCSKSIGEDLAKAVFNHGQNVSAAMENIADAIHDLADAIRSTKQEK